MFMRKLEHIERTVVVAVAVLFTVAVVVAFARQPKPDLVADAIAAIPPPAPLQPALASNLTAAKIYAASPEGMVLHIGDSYTAYDPVRGEKCFVGGGTIAQITEAVLALRYKRYDAIFIMAGIANLKRFDLATTREQLRELARLAEGKFGIKPIVYDPASMICILDDYIASGGGGDGCHFSGDCYDRLRRECALLSF